MTYYYNDDSVIGYLLETTNLIVLLAFYALSIVGMWKLYQKTGEAGWKSLIPIYNLYILYKISWGNGWLFLLNLIPIVNFVINIIMWVKLAKSFGKGAGFAVGLLFLNFIFLMILGFGSAKYIGPDGQPQRTL